jgi:hypothetical protein
MRRAAVPVAVAILAVLLAGAAWSADDPAPLDLATVEGAEHFPGTDRDRQVLARQGFVVLPRQYRQIFSLYIGSSLPHYVTADSAQHTFHVILEAALEDVERAAAGRLKAFAGALHARLAGFACDPRFAAGRDLALAHAAVAARLLGHPAPVPPHLESVVAAEVLLATAAAGPATSPLFGVVEDYAAYAPQSLYEGDPGREAYFRAATWLGRRGFRVVDERETVAALLVVRAVEEEPALRAALAKHAAVLDFLLGPPDDLTVAEYAAAIRGVTGGDLGDAALATRLPAIREALGRLRAPEINTDVLLPAEWLAFRERTKGLRLLPARWTPDAWLFAQVAAANPDHPFASGLLVTLALGSDRAGDHLASAKEAGREAAGVVRARRGEFLRRLGTSFYGGALRAASLLLDPAGPAAGGTTAGPGAPGTPVLPAPVFGTPAWRDRLLAAGFASFVSLRHAFALHAKVHADILCEFPERPGVVEPVPAWWHSLAALSRSLAEALAPPGPLARDPRREIEELLPALRKMLAGGTLDTDERERLARARLEELADPPGQAGGDRSPRELLPRLEAIVSGGRDPDERERALLTRLACSPLRDSFVEFAELADRLGEIAERELRGEALTARDLELVWEYGKTIARLNFHEGNSWLAPEVQMGFVAEISRDYRTGERLQAAVGGAMELFVVLPIRGGGHQLYRGGVFSCYEFPSARPLADSEWLRRVEDGSTPPLPPWAQSGVASPDVEAILDAVACGRDVPEITQVFDPRVGEALLDRLEAPSSAGTLSDEVVWRYLYCLPRYAAGEWRERIFAVLLRTVKERGIGADELARVAGPADRLGLIGVLLRPPIVASRQTQSLMVYVLAEMAEPPDPAELEVLLTDAWAPAREYGLRLLVALPRAAGGEEEAAIVERIVRLLGREPEAAVRRIAFESLWEMADAGPLPSVCAAGIAKYLDDGDPEERRHAAWLLGLLRATEEAEGLLGRLRDEDPRVASAAAAALGWALGRTGGDEPLRARAIAALEKLFAVERWDESVGCLVGLAAMGGEAGAAALARAAGTAVKDSDLRSIAIDFLEETGEVAIPHLFRLAFEETVLRGGYSPVRIRICDEAAEALNRLLGCPFGPAWDLFGSGKDAEVRARQDEILGRILEVAARRGLAPSFGD